MKVISHVKFLDNDTAFVIKDKMIFHEMNPAIGIALRDKTVLVVNMRCFLNNVPVISLVKECRSREHAVNAFYKVIGKMCKKQFDSKYFEGCIYEEHMKNGNPLCNPEDLKRYKEVARTLKAQFDKDC